MVTMLSKATKTTLSNVFQEYLIARLAFHSLWSSVKLATNVYITKMVSLNAIPIPYKNQEEIVECSRCYYNL